MRFNWYYGFGWKAVGLCLVFAAASYIFAAEWFYWVFYALFAIMLAFIYTKYKLYKREPWRRVNYHGMRVYQQIATAAAGKVAANNGLDQEKLCQELAVKLLGSEEGAKLIDSILWTDAGRKAYYRELVDNFPGIFTANIKPENHAKALQGLRQDIDASKLGPDLVIAILIEKTYGRLEAARYLMAVASGLAAQRHIFA